jgi:hypothetical protein
MVYVAQMSFLVANCFSLVGGAMFPYNIRHLSTLKHISEVFFFLHVILIPIGGLLSLYRFYP